VFKFFFMKRILCFVLFLAAAQSIQAQGVERPKLMVGLVIDQMRWDYLYRYYSHYGSNGFRRLMDQGFKCEQTFVNYIPSYTAPGHTCIYTGSVPAIHGIVGNDWTVNGKTVYCTDDDTARPVGGSMRWGCMSPRNLLVTTVTDELRLATNFQSKVFAVSLKDRSSILPGGHLANGVFWFDDSTGTFTSSSYYGNKLPDWVQNFNSTHSVESLLSQDWKLLLPPTSYTQSTEDNVPYEGKFDPSEPSPTFPHAAKYFKGTGVMKYDKIRVLPAGIQLTLDLAEACVTANSMGKGSATDFLCVSISSTDYMGHQFAPNSVEAEDMYTRLDAQLAAFFTFLDSYVGAGNYTLFLTADHGAAHNSVFLNDHKISGGNTMEVDLKAQLNTFLKTKTGVNAPALSLKNNQVVFNTGLSEKTLDSITVLTADWLRARPEIAWVVDPRDPQGVPATIRERVLNGYNTMRGGRLFYLFEPGYYSGYTKEGTTHGAWNPYDTHIPLLWYGWGIKKGQTHREVHMTDIAATVAALLHIQMPSGCIGSVITEIVP
jgi:predicted AlkP superfamily pyrophosphatase or phosphodiesterase